MLKLKHEVFLGKDQVCCRVIALLDHRLTGVLGLREKLSMKQRVLRFLIVCTNCITLLLIGSLIVPTATQASTILGPDGRPVHSGASQPKVLRPDPEILNEIARFTSEWCDFSAESAADQVIAVCYGHASFQSQYEVRAFKLKFKTGQAGLYLENERAGVELRKMKFAILGPVNTVSLPNEFGEVRLQTNADGEIQSVAIKLPSVGVVVAHARR